MLVLTRRINEKIRVGDDVLIAILGIKGQQVKVGVAAPNNIGVYREEIYQRIGTKSFSSLLTVKESIMKSDINNENKTVRFKLVAQNRGDELVIEILDQGLLMIRSAREVIKNPELLYGFSPEDIARIGLAAGMELAAT
jgi:carbon storage regulator